MKTLLTHPLSVFTRSLFTLALGASCTAVAPLGFAADSSETPFIAHEWGTFTSVQGSDGILLDWNGAETGDLPEFVYNWSKPGLNRVFTPMPANPLLKVSLTALQRMETPVIYFYTPEARTVDLSVAFPQGTITEWFPQAWEIGPSRPAPPVVLNGTTETPASESIAYFISCGYIPSPQAVTKSLIRWKRLEVLPTEQNDSLVSKLPTTRLANHYFAARETDAAFVSVASMEPGNNPSELEKFLFYRGVGNFQTPLKVTVDAKEEIKVSNVGTASLKHLFALTVRDGQAAFQPLGRLDSTKSEAVRIDLAKDGLPLEQVVEKLRSRMVQALTEEGLYAREAEAMVKTWRDAWFEEQGTRILYVLPRAWTDQILPLTINPQPSELVRIMVGRSEVIAPTTENKLREAITLFAQADGDARQQAIQKFQALRLGRFASPAIKLALGKTPNPTLQKQAAELLQTARKVPALTDASQRRSGVLASAAAGNN